MASPLRALLRRFVSGGSLALLGVLLAPAGASASCGDYVHILPPNGAAAPERPTSEEAAANQTATPTPKPNCPCRGPECSRAPRPLLPPAPPTPSPTPTDAIALPDSVPDPLRASPVEAVEFFLPANTPDPIFHPPRG